MNTLIEQHFNNIELRLLESPVVVSVHRIRREISLTDGKLRLKASLQDGGIVELFEYVNVADARIHLAKYSFHWQNASGKLKQRWDNAPHHPQISTFPDHFHKGDERTIVESDVSLDPEIDLRKVLGFITLRLT